MKTATMGRWSEFPSSAHPGVERLEAGISGIVFDNLRNDLDERPKTLCDYNGGFMSYLKMVAHIGWATKKRRKALHPGLDAAMESTARKTLERIGCRLLAFGSAWDHVHLAVSFGGNTSSEKVAREVKRDLTVMLRKHDGLEKFRWQDGYWAFSAQPRRLSGLLGYVRNQRRRHRRQSLQEELDAFAKLLDEG